MSPSIFIGIAYALWLLLSVYLVVTAIGMKKDVQLHIRHRYVRHPMYVGGLLACIGSAIAAGGGWVFPLIVLGSLFFWRVGAEDN